MVVVTPADGGSSVPVMTTKGLVALFAEAMPACAWQNGVVEVPPVAVVEHPVIFCTYTVSASVAQCPSARHTPGPPPLAAHWASLVQAWQVKVVVVSQIGEVPEQSPLSAQPTHWPALLVPLVLDIQTGVVPVQAFVPAFSQATQSFW
jgi:hypothetical protein